MEARHYSDKIAIAAHQNVKEKEYWLEQLSGDLVKSCFPYDRSEIKAAKPGEHNRAAETFDFPENLVLELEKISSGIDIKLHMVLVAGLVLLLNKYTSSKDILTGAPVLKQESEADFINRVLVLRNRVDEHMSFKELLLQVRETIITASENQNFPIEVLPDLLNLPIEENEFPLFDVVLLLENIHDKNYLGNIHYNMLFSFSRPSERIEGVIEYNFLRYSQRMIRQIINHFTNVLEQALSDLNVKLTDIDMLSEQEKKQLLEDFNANDIDFPKDKTFQQLFEEQAAKVPQNIAVAAQGVEKILSYKELNERANRLAQVLRKRGVTANTITAVMVGRSIDMIVAVMAVIKAGGAYLPVDPEYPVERIDFILKDSRSSILVTQVALKDNLDFDGEVIAVDDEIPAGVEPGNLETVNSPSDLVYVIYTSGSTGNPKGVMVQHNQFVNLAYGWQREYCLQEIEVNLLQMASISFDVFAGDLARTFLNGGKMVINPLMAVEPESIYKLIKAHRVTLFESTPSYIIPFMQYVYENKLEIDSLQLLILGSDTCPFRDYRKLLARFGKQMRIVNSYGVTEATIDSSYYEEYNLENMPSSGNVPIGKPLPNVKFYILDQAGKLLPIGVPGELYIGGSSVSRGYLYREELTAERFVTMQAASLKPQAQASTHQLTNSSTHALLYRTGDLARWLPDGNVEFLGRLDYQIKVRGYRIELGEIEYRLLEHPGIKEAVVVEKIEDSGDKYLVGYFTAAESLEPADLRDFLSRKLPDYMVPWFFVQLETLPLTGSGKIDRKSLPEPQASGKKAYAAPRNKTEEELVKIWSRVLALDKEEIGIDDNFFDLGGNSLKAIIIASGIHKKFDVKIQLVDIFKIQTIRGVAEFIKGSEQEKFAGLKPAAHKDYYALSSAQKRLYILQQLELESTSYNIPLVIKLTGKLNKERFEETFKKLIDRHECLRTSFVIVSDEPVQKIHRAEDIKFAIEYYSLERKVQSAEPVGANLVFPRDHGSPEINVGVRRAVPGEQETGIIERFTRPFDLSQAPLLRVGIIETGKEEYILMVEMHHIISDAVSHGVLVRDFSALYDGQELPPLVLRYRDFSEWQNSEEEKERINQQEEYWLKEFAGEIPVLKLPTDYPRPGFQSFSGSMYRFKINQGEFAALKALAREEGVTTHMMMLALLFILLGQLGDSEDIVIGTPVAGRGHADLENMIGVFINILAIRSFPSAEKAFLQFLREVKEKCLLALKNQDYQFEDLVKQVVTSRDMSRSPLFDVIFEVQQHRGRRTEEKQEEKPGLTFSYYPVTNKTSKFDLDWVGVETEEAVFFTITYCTDLFEEETIEQIAQGYRGLLKNIIRNSEYKIKDLDYGSPPGRDMGREKVEVNGIEFKF